MKAFVRSLVIVTMCLMLCASGHSQATRVFDYIQSNGVDYKVDMLLITYPSSFHHTKNISPSSGELNSVGNQAMKKFNVKTALIMPDNLLPIAIPKERFAEVKKLIGQSCIVLTNIKCDKPECLDE